MLFGQSLGDTPEFPYEETMYYGMDSLRRCDILCSGPPCWRGGIGGLLLCVFAYLAGEKTMVFGAESKVGGAERGK